MDKQKSAFYNGITFVDIERQVDLPTDFETDRIPNKSDVMVSKVLLVMNQLIVIV